MAVPARRTPVHDRRAGRAGALRLPRPGRLRLGGRAGPRPHVVDRAQQGGAGELHPGGVEVRRTTPRSRSTPRRRCGAGAPCACRAGWDLPSARADRRGRARRHRERVDPALVPQGDEVRVDPRGALRTSSSFARWSLPERRQPAAHGRVDPAPPPISARREGVRSNRRCRLRRSRGWTMAIFNAMFPVLPGKEGAAREFAAAVAGRGSGVRCPAGRGGRQPGDLDDPGDPDGELHPRVVRRRHREGVRQPRPSARTTSRAGSGRRSSTSPASTSPRRTTRRRRRSCSTGPP